MPTLTPAERNRLVGILGMLGSDHIGERAAAAALASRLVRDKGLSWDAVIPVGGAQPGAGWTGSARGPGSAGQDDMAFCLRWLAMLSGWEVQFITSLRTRRRPLTPGQATKLGQIAGALRARGLA